MQAYLGTPDNPDAVSTEQIRFYCKTQCLDECFKDGRDDGRKYYDSTDPDKEWLLDPSISLTCSDFTTTTDPNDWSSTIGPNNSTIEPTNAGNKYSNEDIE